jgi:hypothetical protein
LRLGLRNIRQSPIVRRLVADQMVISVAAYYVLWTWQRQLQLSGVPVAWWGLVNVLFVGVEILVMRGAPALGRLLGGPRRFLVAQALFTGIGFVLMIVVQSAALVITGIALAAGFGLSRGNVMVSYVNHQLASEQRATSLSAINMLRSGTTMLLSPGVGAAMDRSTTGVLGTLGAVCLVWAGASRSRAQDLETPAHPQDYSQQ